MEQFAEFDRNEVADLFAPDHVIGVGHSKSCRVALRREPFGIVRKHCSDPLLVATGERLPCCDDELLVFLRIHVRSPCCVMETLKDIVSVRLAIYGPDISWLSKVRPPSSGVLMLASSPHLRAAAATACAQAPRHSRSANRWRRSRDD